MLSLRPHLTPQPRHEPVSHLAGKHQLVAFTTTKPELQDKEIGELWRRYRRLEGQDAITDSIVALLRKLVIQGAKDIPYENWEEKLSHPLGTYGIARSEWDSNG